MAMLTGLLLRKTVLQGEPSPLVMELPPYHIPNLKTLMLNAWGRLRGFLFRAGKLIIPICILIGVLSALNLDGNLIVGDGDANSLLSALGRFFTPIFAPMGIHQDNWPATVGLITGVLAKEVVVGTLNALYSQVGHLAILQASGFSFFGGLHDALVSIPQNLSQLGGSFGNPVLAQAPVHTLTQSVYGLMYQRFDGQIGAFAYLLFVLLYFPCVSTTAVMLRELNRAWTLFSVAWSTAVAYGAAVLFYQAATFKHHPLSSALWIAGILVLLGATIIAAKSFTFKLNGKKYKRLLPTGEVI
jgi:ferrous iron transport protein B